MEILAFFGKPIVTDWLERQTFSATVLEDGALLLQAEGLSPGGWTLMRVAGVCLLMEADAKSAGYDGEVKMETVLSVATREIWLERIRAFEHELVDECAERQLERTALQLGLERL